MYHFVMKLADNLFRYSNMLSRNLQIKILSKESYEKPMDFN